jgi:hypothetical protein
MPGKKILVKNAYTLKGNPKSVSTRIRNAFLYFAPSLLICTALICGSATASAQTTESSGEQAQEAQPVSGSSPSSSDQVSEVVCWRLAASENQKRPRLMGPEKVKRGYQFPKRTPF